MPPPSSSILFTAPPTSALHTLSLHDALPISPARISCLRRERVRPAPDFREQARGVPIGGTCAPEILDDFPLQGARVLDRKSTRLNSSHPSISYAVFCLKRKTIAEGAAMQQKI